MDKKITSKNKTHSKLSKILKHMSKKKRKQYYQNTKHVFNYLSVVCLLFVMLIGCGPSPKTTITVEPSAEASVDSGLDLRALGELVKNSKTAEQIEKSLNTPGSINNLDVNKSGNVSYIHVKELDSAGQKGFNFYVDNSGTKVDVATVMITQDQANQQASMNIQGNQQFYGSNYSYQSNFGFTDLLIMNYLFFPHSLYFSPYYYGFYPGYYHSWGRMSYGAYRTSVNSYTRTSTIRSTSGSSSRASGASSSGANSKGSLSNPSGSQKSFSSGDGKSSSPSTKGFSSSGSGSSSKGGFGSSGGSHGGSSGG
jgi:hypothetical protein